MFLSLRLFEDADLISWRRRNTLGLQKRNQLLVDLLLPDDQIQVICKNARSHKVLSYQKQAQKF